VSKRWILVHKDKIDLQKKMTKKNNKNDETDLQKKKHAFPQARAQAVSPNESEGESTLQVLKKYVTIVKFLKYFFLYVIPYSFYYVWINFV
jgi:hypothetical protein